MLHAYVGLVSRRGLELFCPEHPQTMRFLWRRVRREQGRVTCFWSVIPAEIVEHILDTLQLGRSRDALLLMQRHSREYGSLIPCEEESPPDPANRDHG